MPCKYSKDDIINYVEGIISEEKSIAIKEHMKHCEKCMNYYEILVLSKNFASTETSVDESIHRKIIGSIDRDRYKTAGLLYRLGSLMSSLYPILKPVSLAAVIFAVAITAFYNRGQISSLIGSNLVSNPTGSYTAKETSTPDKNPDTDKEEKQLYNNYPEPKEDFNGKLVYQEMVLDRLYQGDFGWSLGALCYNFGVKFVPVNDKYNIYKEWKVPLEFYLRRHSGKRLIEIKVVGTIDEGYKNSPHMAYIEYKVYKDNKELKLSKPPVTYKTATSIDIKDFLEILEIEHYIDPSTNLTYVGSDKKTPITGRFMDDRNIEITPGNPYNVKLLYYYDKQRPYPYFENIDLIIQLAVTGDKTFSDAKANHFRFTLLNGRGSADYYKNASIDVTKARQDTLLGIGLSSYIWENGDYFVYKYTSSGFEPVFSQEDYKKYMDNFFLETDSKGNCTLVDRINNVRTPFKYKGIHSNIVYSPNMIYPVKFTGFNVAEEESTKLVSRGIVYNTEEESSIFWVDIEFEYDGSTFIPTRVVSYDYIKNDMNNLEEKPLQTVLFEYNINK